MRLLLNIWEQGYNDRVCREHTKHGWHLPHFSVLQPDKSTTKELFLTNLQNSMENHSMMLSTPVQSSCEDEAEDEDEGALTIHKSPNCICLCHCRKVLKYC